MSDTQREHRGLTEEHAHRILARAVELDSQHASHFALSDLRAAAIEAGIQAEAFDRAAGEVPTSRAAPPVDQVTESSRWTPVVANLKAVFAFWVALTILTRVGRLLPYDWAVSATVNILACGIGVWFAVRFRASVVRIGLTGVAAALVALFAVHSVYGIESAQGGPTQFAVLIAGVLAAGMVALRGRFLPRRGRGLAPATLEQSDAIPGSHHEAVEAGRLRPLSLVRVGSV